MSHDFEDIIYVIDNNLELVDDTIRAEEPVRKFLAEMANYILNHPSKDEIIECHLNPFTAQERKQLILNRLKKIG